MNALTAVTATVYAIALWMFAPRSIWDKELATAKQNQQNRLNPTPEPIQETEPEASAQPETTPEPIPEPVPTPEPITAIVEPITEPIPDTQPIEPDTVAPEPLNLETFTTTQLRELAKKQKLNWRPLVKGKRTPLKKPELIQLLTA